MSITACPASPGAKWPRPCCCSPACPPDHQPTWSLGHLVTCPPGHLTTCSPGHLAICLPAHLVTWLSAHLVTCPPGHLPPPLVALLSSALQPKAPQPLSLPQDWHCLHCGWSVGQAPSQGEPCGIPVLPSASQCFSVLPSASQCPAPPWGQGMDPAPRGLLPAPRGELWAPRPRCSGRAVTARLAGVPSEYFILHNITTQRCCSCTASA